MIAGNAVALQCAVGTIAFHDDGGVRSCVIDAHHRFSIEGRDLWCRAGAVLATHADGGLARCTLWRSFATRDLDCPPGSVAEVSDDAVLQRCGN